ncbi:MAG: DEAD/DEAH box helicase family protein [Victivallales bacterium]|nr:DEAD/DEAH box helicase family protein [Victivallales bacterium]
MNGTVDTICKRMSLRSPQSESLKILAELAAVLKLEKGADLAAELEKVHSLYPTCTDFERAFVSLAFGIATGVGKTRLMGAFITYLFIERGIRNFFIMAPNLTIYNKLIEDFSNPAHPKYVFNGIGGFMEKPPRVVTGDNYASRTDLDFYSDLCVNVFNISKLNAETRNGQSPRIKRLSECLGESYFNYLAGLDDLVLLMDESHHYRADRGMAVINELNPVLGLELTATPQVVKGSRSAPFRNVVYEYSLARALRDGFVKKPAVATRGDFDPGQYRGRPEALDRVKLEDGISIHETTKIALEIYAGDHGVKTVKPFTLVVARDTEHAGELKKLIMSEKFFDGYYADKVMEIHSGQSGGEKEENIEKLLALESPDNKMEIVIHVNMLKEGWDVNNLYTIIPLRASASETLTEQTIGRGLRLPYGTITGNSDVDTLTIVAHDRFQAIVDKANEPDSIIRQENVIIINEAGNRHHQEVFTIVPKVEEKLEAEAEAATKISDAAARQAAETRLQARRAVLKAFSEMNRHVNSTKELTLPENRQIALEKVRENLGNDLWGGDVIRESGVIYEQVAEEFDSGIIEIPEMQTSPANEYENGFNDFDLDTGALTFRPVSAEIMRKNLADHHIDRILSRCAQAAGGSMENLILTELRAYPEVDYEKHSELLFKLVSQALDKLESYLDEDEVRNVVEYYRRDLAEFIYRQLREHYYCRITKYVEDRILPYIPIREHRYSRSSVDQVYSFRDTVAPVSAIPARMFGGFEKACHRIYKFDSKTEKDFAVILEDDDTVLKWLRPAHGQLRIYYDRGRSRSYEPDFIVETPDAIYMVETKNAAETENPETREKAGAACAYCRRASAYTAGNRGKEWKYLLIPHTAVTPSRSFGSLAQQFSLAD